MKFVYIDDSQITLSGETHIILSGIVTASPIELYKQVNSIRRKNAVKQFEELKSAPRIVNNQNGFLQDITYTIMDNTETCLCVISKGDNKQTAALVFIEQLLSYSAGENDLFQLWFDKGIVNQSVYESIKAMDYGQKITGVQSIDSKHDFGIQIADWFVTQFKTNLVFKIKEIDKTISITGSEATDDMSYRFYSDMSIRYHWWGDVLNSKRQSEFGNGETPVKFIVGKGIIVRSSQEIVELIDRATSVYMGCIH